MTLCYLRRTFGAPKGRSIELVTWMRRPRTKGWLSDVV